MIYEYTNPDYEPQLHDFGDDYHNPDVEEVGDSNILSQVKKIRRRYTNWFDYVDACNLYDLYMNEIFDKYGGKDNFKLAMLLGQVREYLPNYPELRKTKKNRYYAKRRMSRPIKFDEDNLEYLELDIPDEPVTAKVTIDHSGKLDQYYDDYADRQVALESVANELATLDAWFQHRTNQIRKAKVGKKKKNDMIRKVNRKALRLSTSYKSLTDMINLYDKEKRDKFYGRTVGASIAFKYKGTIASQSEMEQIELRNHLKAIGVKTGKLTKAQTKIIRGTSKKDLKKAKKSKKKLNKLEDKFIKDFTNQEYDDFETFEEEVINCHGDGDRRFDF